MDNRTIARRLFQEARCLHEEQASLYRVRAYRRAAETILGLEQSAERIVAEQGDQGLTELPGIGRALARWIATLVRTGEAPTLNHDFQEGAKGVNEECHACGVSSR